ncbi:hypothetical protein E05_48040 [Plautia stali symbiont]|nr:hypothetical protein E05_48040 [Plautia stali symbiont]
MIWRWFWREWRSPSLLIVWLALGSISDRMEKGLSQQSRDFMAGDRTLRSSKPAPDAWLDKAREEGLAVSRQLSFMTMTFAQETPQLADIKAVDDAYPMFGILQTDPPGLRPVAGTVLAAPRLLVLLNLKVGDRIDVGYTTLRIAGEVIQEPDGGFNPFQTAPRLLMNLADVEKTGAIQPGSRLSWRYTFSGEAAPLARYDRWIEPQLQAGERWISVENSEDALGRSMQRAQQFLLLSALLTLLLAIAAVAVAMSHYCRSRYDLVALLMGGSKMLWALLAGVVMLALLLALLGWGTLLLLRRLVVRNLALRLAINRLLRQPAMTLSQLAAFSLSLYAAGVIAGDARRSARSLAAAITGGCAQLFSTQSDPAARAAGRRFPAAVSG